MSITLLRSFVEVYRQGSVSRASEQLGLTQPAVSGHIASLEAMIERKLFSRHARGVKPTVIADELVRRVAGAIDTAENALAEAKARSKSLTGTIHICGPSDILSDLVLDRLRLLTSSNLSVNLAPATGTEILDRVTEGRADFGFSVVVPDDPKVDCASYGAEELILVACPEVAEQIAGRGPLADGLSKTPYIDYDLDQYLVRQWLDHNGIALRDGEVIATAPDLRAIRNLVTNGFGWSVLPAYLVRSGLKDGTLAQITGDAGNPTVEFFLVWSKSAMRNPRSAMAKSLLLRAWDDDAMPATDR